jgi:NAD(P)-dependent dehydrogenase (short-subunit alcohol dehydrogenase family)
MFSNNLANEVAGRGVRINCVAPARVLTERMERRVPNGAKRQAASVPLGRMGTPEDVAATLLLVSAASARITGVTSTWQVGQDGALVSRDIRRHVRAGLLIIQTGELR